MASSPAPKINQTWLVTFADLMALLLSFFVMLYGMSVMQTEAWKSIVTSLSDELSPGHDQSLLQTPQKGAPLRIAAPAGIDLDYLHAVMVEKFRNDLVLRNVRPVSHPDRLSIAVPVALLFEPYSLRPAAGAERVIGAVSEALLGVANRVEIHAYVSSRAPAAGSGQLVSYTPWELGLARAHMLAAELNDTGIRREIRPFGHSSDTVWPRDGRLEFVVREMGASDE